MNNIAIGNNGKTYRLVKASYSHCTNCCFRPGKTNITCAIIHKKLFNIKDAHMSCMKLAIDFFGYTDTKDIYFYFEEIDNNNLEVWKNILRR